MIYVRQCSIHGDIDFHLEDGFLILLGPSLDGVLVPRKAFLLTLLFYPFEIFNNLLPQPPALFFSYSIILCPISPPYRFIWRTQFKKKAKLNCTFSTCSNLGLFELFFLLKLLVDWEKPEVLHKISCKCWLLVFWRSSQINNFIMLHYIPERVEIIELFTINIFLHPAITELTITVILWQTSVTDRRVLNLKFLADSFGRF